jgi:hypothetical protein
MHVSIHREVNRCASLGKAFARQAGVVVRETAKVISDQAEQRLRDAQPVVRETLQRAASGTRKHAQRLRSAAGDVAHRAVDTASQKLLSCKPRHLTAHASRLRSACHKVTPAAVSFTASSMLITAAIGLLVMGYSFWRSEGHQPAGSVVGSRHGQNLPLVNGEIAQQSLRVEEAPTATQNPALAAAQVEFEQATAEYEFTAQQWNAEVAACQSAPTAQYSSRQMGVFAAMGVNAPMQPSRQPNQFLYQAACQAEQRYLQAKAGLEACMQ